MSTRVYNVPGGLYSGDAFTAFEGECWQTSVANLDCFAVTAGDGMALNISAGQAIIKTSVQTYRVGSDATESVTISTVSTANPRIDAVVMYVDLSVEASTAVQDNVDLGMLKFATVTGIASSSPSNPTATRIQSTVGAGNPYMVLAYVTVPANATASSSFTITDARSSASIIRADNIDFTTLEPRWYTIYYSATNITDDVTITKTLPDGTTVVLQSVNHATGLYIKECSREIAMCRHIFSSSYAKSTSASLGVSNIATSADSKYWVTITGTLSSTGTNAQTTYTSAGTTSIYGDFSGSDDSGAKTALSGTMFSSRGDASTSWSSVGQVRLIGSNTVFSYGLLGPQSNIPQTPPTIYQRNVPTINSARHVIELMFAD